MSLALFIVALLLPGVAAAQTSTRAGDHPGFGRVVFDFATPTGFEVVEADGRMLIVFEGGAAIAAPGNLPRNVRAIEGGVGAATLLLAPGARIRSARMGNRIVIDVLDPAPRQVGSRSPGRTPVTATPVAPTRAAAAPSAIPSSSGSRPESMPSESGSAQTGAPQATNTAAPAAPPPPAPQPAAAPLAQLPESGREIITEPVAAPSPAGTTTLARAVADGPSVVPGSSGVVASMVVPFDAGVGAAAFRRGTDAFVVFDQRLSEASLSAMGSSPDAFIRTGVSTTILSVPLRPDQHLLLRREPAGWSVTRTEVAVSLVPIEMSSSPSGVLFNVERSGRVVSVSDPVTGQSLLVGTVDPASGTSPAGTSYRRFPTYALAPTWLGVVVEPLSDQIEFRPVAAGFLLTAPGLPTPADVPEAATGSFVRRFDFPDLPVPALLQRLKAQTAAAAAASPRARSNDRLAVARSLLSLGLAAEAQAVLALVATDDPAVANHPDLVGLISIAALLSGRDAEAAGLDDRRLDGSDDIALWRGIRGIMRDTTSETARELPRLLPLVESYPAALRDRLRPLVIEAAVATGQSAMVDKQLSRPGDPTLDFARALRLEREGDKALATVAFESLTTGRDQLIQVRAGVRAAELRLHRGVSSAGATADALERLATSWRGDDRESRMRIRVAELRSQAGAFRTALELLRDTERLFPEQKPVLRAAMAAVFQAMLTQPTAVPPLDLVILSSEFAAMLPASDAGDVSALLADKLVALDLPDRAGPVLATLMANAAPGPVRASIGARLAQLQLDAGLLPAAQATLRASDAPDLPQALLHQRGLIVARSLAALGDRSAATALLLTLASAPADDLRATLSSEAGDWPGSLAALSDLAAKTIPDRGPLTEAMQDIVLRQATSAVQANDHALLAELKRRHTARLTEPRSDLFRLLTSDPLRSPSDLPRTASELAAAKLVPERLQAIAGRNIK